LEGTILAGPYASRLLIVAALTAVIHMINTLIYSVRLAGIRSGRLATALSLFQIIFLLASTANLVQAPLLSSIVEHSINEGLRQAVHPGLIQEAVQTAAYQQQLHLLESQIRLVIVAATLGTVLGALLIPAFVNVFTRAILLFDHLGSVPRLIGYVLFSPRRVVRILGEINIPPRRKIRASLKEPLGIPRGFLLTNIIVTGIWTIGVLSALLAAAMFPQFRSTATLLAGVVNGVAAVLAATIVDPRAAMITDQALRGEREEKDVRQMAAYLALTRFAGTIVAQAIFVPAALLIRLIAEWLV
jgi:hypothetical protein